MFVILLNCVTLGMYQPCVDETCDTNRCKILQMFDDAIFAFFAVEMVIKMVAMGWSGKGSYMADSWNRLDLFIVFAGGLEYFLAMENMNLSAIRTIRVLRPLRAINRIPSMRILVMLLLDTLPMLGNVLLLCFFVFFIFGIVGVQLWAGMLRQRCFIDLPKNVTAVPGPITSYFRTDEQEKDYICSLPKDNGMHKCQDLPPTKYQGKQCNDSALLHVFNEPTNESCVNWNQYYTDCRPGDRNPFQGAISFDNIGLAWVAIFLVISLEGWTDIMYYVQDAHSFWDWIYFVLLIVIGSFFMINLCLVVIATQFSETKKREMERMKMERARFQSTSTLASGSTSEPNSCYAEIIKYIAHLWRRGKRKLYFRYRQFRRRNRSEHPRQLSLKKQRRRRQYEAAQSALITRESGPSGMLNTVVAVLPAVSGGVGPGGAFTVMNNISSTTPQLLSPPEMHEVPDESRNNSAPRASPEFSDIDPQTSPRRPVLLKVSSGASGDGSNELLPPSPGGQGICTPRHRRRSSVMFSDVVLLHGHAGETATKNVCHSEKTTQTDDEPIDPAYFREPLPPSPHSLGPPSVIPPTLLPPTLLPPNKTKSSLRSVSRTPSYNGSGGKGSLTCGELLALSGALSAALPTHLGIDSRSVHTLYSSLAKGVKHFSAPTLFFSADQGPAGFTGYYSASDSCNSESDWSDEEWKEEEKRPPSLVHRLCSQVRIYIKKLVEHRYFQRGILVAILINTLSMGVEYHNQPEMLTVIVETSNYIFSAVFAIEMLLKIIAEGPFGYISNGFNVFDGVIVILSVVEMYESYSTSTTAADQQAGQGSGLSVLRTFRLLRILKLVRFMPQLRRQLFVMLRTMDNVAIFFSLLILFIFIFSVLGMFLFGGKFCIRADGSGDCTCQEILDPESGCLCTRMHFNNFLWATVTVFQILTQEDWNVVLFNGMEKTSHWASLYFVALMTFGNYMLFNLLVAILVEGFSAERNERLEKEQKQLEKQKRKEQRALEQASDGSDDDNPSRQEEDKKTSPSKASSLEKTKDDPLEVTKAAFLELSKGTPAEMSAGTASEMPKSISSEVVSIGSVSKVPKDSATSMMTMGTSTEVMAEGISEKVMSRGIPTEVSKCSPTDMSKDIATEVMSKGTLVEMPEAIFPGLKESPLHQSQGLEISNDIQGEEMQPSVSLQEGDRPAEDEKKRSASTLEGPDDEQRLSKGNEDRVKENQLRQKLLDVDPKCNIEKENKLLQLPQSVGREIPPTPAGFTPLLATPSTQLGYPPIITHTAATPQGSPHATLEPSGRGELNNRLSPAMALYCSTPDQRDCSQGVLRSASIKSNNTSLSSRSSRASSRLGPHGVHRRESLSPHDLPGHRDSLSPSPGVRERRSSGCGSPLSWRRNGSQRRRRGHSSTRSSFRRAQVDRENLVRHDSGSDADGEEETALNNNITLTNNNLNNHQSSLLGTDHSHCNGSTSSHVQLAPRRSILTQQNSIGSPRTLSPQNSIRSRGSSPRSRQPSIQGQTSVSGSIRELEYKQNNLSRAKEAAAVAEQEEAQEACETEAEAVKKLCFVFEPKGCFKERQDYSLYVFSPDNPIRRICLFLVSRRWFDSTVLFFIGLNCISLAMERPNIPPYSVERRILMIFNYIFTVVFGVEMVIKVIAQGLLYGKGAYFNSGWNIMDGSLVLISIIDILMSILATTSPRIFGILRVFRLLRALRPLRVINRAPGLKLVVQTLLSSLQPIGNIVLICCTFFIIFGILGVQLFKGSFYYCDGPNLKNIITKSDCLQAQGNLWINRKYNFDDLGQALMSLFVLSSKDGWVNIMYTGLDAVGVDLQPVENYSQWRLLYFISFLLLVGFFVLNMFVGVVVENFHRCREEQEKEEKARRAAKRAKKLEKKRRKMREPPYYSHYSRARLFIHNIVTSKYFDLAIAAVIGLNVVTMAMEFYKMPKELDYALQIFNYFFTAVFILESAVKMVALGCRRYFQDSNSSMFPGQASEAEEPAHRTVRNTGQQNTCKEVKNKIKYRPIKLGTISDANPELTWCVTCVTSHMGAGDLTENYEKKKFGEKNIKTGELRDKLIGMVIDSHEVCKRNNVWMKNQGFDSSEIWHDYQASPPLTPGLPDIRVDTSLNIPSININGRGFEVEGVTPTTHLPPFTHEEDLYNPNLKRPSPDEPVDKVSITNLRQMPSVGARTGSSTPTQPLVEKENNKKVTNGAPLAGSFEGDDDVSVSDGQAQGPSSQLLKDQGSLASQRAQRQSRWRNCQEFSSGGGHKVSLDDSLKQTLMASFDNVPELGGRVDMDSTSCSVCSSEEMSVASRLSSGPSPLATITSGTSTAKDNTQVLSPHPQIALPPPHVFADDDDATLASSSDSFTLEGVPHEIPSLDSSPGSEGIDALSATASPHSSSPSPLLSSPVSEPANAPFKSSPDPSKSTSDSTDSSYSSRLSPTPLSAPLSAPVNSSLSELANLAQPFSSLSELRAGGYNHFSSRSPTTLHRDFQPSLAESSQPLPPQLQNMHPCLRSEGSQLWLSRHEDNQFWPSRPEHSLPWPSSTIGLQLGNPRPQSRAHRLPSGQKCYIQGRSKYRHSGTES
ncbi:voltage-dependent T-type calcium channel subunit alpha-1G-like [Panulirus ornatus]|uniref:voltage-dependent T-type calcium channel subunit alpha-1G-like n=1 Tax=Panulirus ornatus TaxID=150431 RepID=UPI003A87D885